MCNDVCEFSGFTTEAEGAGDGAESSIKAPWQRAPQVTCDPCCVRAGRRGGTSSRSRSSETGCSLCQTMKGVLSRSYQGV